MNPAQRAELFNAINILSMALKKTFEPKSEDLDEIRQDVADLEDDIAKIVRDISTLNMQLTLIQNHLKQAAEV